jgi:DNA-binding SARP family transcriptional activator
VTIEKQGPRPELVRARVLGGFTVAVGGRELGRAAWYRLSAERLFKLLAVTPGHRLPRELAAETLWPGLPPEAGRTNLRKALHYARRALGNEGVLIGDGDAVALDPTLLDLDLDRLLMALDGAGAVGGTGAGPFADAAGLDTVLDLGGRDLLPDDLYEDWLVGPRERLRDIWLRTALGVAGAARDRGRNGEALAIVDRVLERDPADEAAHRLAIELYAAEGRHHAARRQFDQCRSILRSTLDVEPGPETVAAYRAVERSAARSPRPAPAGAALVARRFELEVIETALDRLVDGRLAVVLLHGPAGIGKTRLLQEIVAYGRAAGWRVAGWQAVEALRTEAFAPLALGLTTVLEPDEVASWAEPARSGVATLSSAFGRPALTFRERSALIEALVEALTAMARARPLVLALDDLPWLDEPSLDLLATLVGARAACPILVAATYRDDEPVPDGVRRLAEQARRAGGISIPVGPLARRDVEPLITGHLGGQSVLEAVSRTVFELSGGNPLFCLEAVRAGRQHDVLRIVDGRWTMTRDRALDDLPESARQLTVRRAAMLSPAARELLDVAAELGPVIAFDVLAATLARPDRDLIEALDEALRSGLLVERSGGYAFGHPLYRVAVREGSGTARRATLHLSIARAMAGDAAEAVDPDTIRAAAARATDPTAVAHHASEAAGLGRREALPLAVAFGFEAARRHALVHDRSEAASLYEQALGLWRQLPGADPRAWGISGAYVALGTLRALAADWSGAATAFRQATALASTPDEIAEAYHEFADTVPYRRGDFEATRVILEEGLARLPAGAHAERAVLRSASGWCLVRMRRIDEALPVMQAAFEEMGEAPDPAVAIKVLDKLGVALHYAGRGADERRGYLERALALAIESRDSTWETVTTLHLGVLFARSGELARARPHQERAVELARLTGDRYLEALAAGTLAETADALGDYPAAVAARRRELQLLDDTGGHPHNAAMAQAHLARLARLLDDGPAMELASVEARRLASASDEVGYAARIERAIAADSWADVDT